MKITCIPFGTLLLSLAAMTAQAALIPVEGGKLIDDTANNTLWVSDANLFKTLANADGDPTAFVNKVIAAVDGVINDTPSQWDTPAYSGHYTLTARDFATSDGHTNWYGAQAFIAYLNSIHYLGYSDWRQPVTITSFSDFLPVGNAPGDVDPKSGELAELFYTELGARVSSNEYLRSVNGNAVLFHNLQDSYYYATEGTADPDTAGLFLFGYSVEHIKIGGNKDPASVWPVRSGQASVKDLITAVAAKIQATDSEGHADLVQAEQQLQNSCPELDKFLNESRPKGSYVDNDVEAIRRRIGCP